MAERELGILVTARDAASRTLQNIGREVSGLDRTVGRGMTNIGRNLERGLVVGGVALAGGIAYAVREAGNFEAALNTINTVAQVTPQRLGAIGDELRAMSRETGTSLDDLTTGYYDLVSAGIKAADAQNVLRASNRLAIGGLSTTSEAIDLLTTAINSYGGDASRAAEFADYFAKAIEQGKVTAADLASSFANVGPLAANMGIELRELAAAYGQLTQKGETGASASTAMAAAMIALQRQTAPMEKLSRDLGINFAELAAQEGLAKTWQLIAAEAAKAGIPLIEFTGRQEALAYVLGVSGDNIDTFNAKLEDMGSAGGTAARQMSERQQGLNFQLARFTANVRDAAIEIGTALLPEMTDLASTGVGWLTTHRADIRGFAQDFAGAFREGISWLTSLDWSQITNTLSGLGGIGKGLLEAFLGMPPWVQTAVLTGWGLNKLSGGALGSLIGALGVGIIKGVLNMNAGVVNINAARVVGPGGPGVPGGPGGGGGKFPFLPVAGALTIPLALSSGDASAQTQAMMLAQRLKGGEGFDEALRGSGATRAAVQELLRNEELLVGIRPADLSRMQDLVGQLVPLGPQRPPVTHGLHEGGPAGLAQAVAPLLPDTSMIEQGAQATQSLPPIIDRAVQRLGTIAAIEAGIARSAAATAAKDLTVSMSAIFTANLTVDGRRMAAITLERQLATGTDQYGRGHR